MRMNDLEQMAIERLKAASDMSFMAYQQPLVICISGGKDSGVITELAVRSGIPCEFQHNHTTADAPETVRFVRSEFKRLEGKGYKCTVNMPVYKLYLNAFERMLEERKRRNKESSRETADWTTAEDVFRWWMEYDVLPGQTSMEDFQ